MITMLKVVLTSKTIKNLIIFNVKPIRKITDSIINIFSENNYFLLGKHSKDNEKQCSF